MLLGLLARGSPAGSVAVAGLGVSALPVAVVVVSWSLVGQQLQHFWDCCFGCSAEVQQAGLQ